MTTWKKIIANSKEEAITLFSASKTRHQLTVAKNKILGKKSLLLTTFNQLLPEEKKTASQELKKIKLMIEKAYQNYYQKLAFPEKKKLIYDSYHHENLITEGKDFFTPLLEEEPQINFFYQMVHPIEATINQFHHFAQKMHWNYRQGNDLEDVHYNFSLLNIDKLHPAHQLQDCFFLQEGKVLRTHTTNVTARELVAYGKDHQPRQIYTVGNVYRNDTDDAKHLPQFHQIDVLLIGEKNYSLASLKWILIKMCQFFFGKKIKTRFRNSYFPFTQPSLELDISCLFCHQQGCQVCEKTGWIELLGGGIIHPQVLVKSGIKTPQTIGLAFGLGVERITMLQYGIKDIRDFQTSLFKTKITTRDDHQS